MTSPTQSPRLYLIDAHSLLYQVFHAIGEMNSPGGMPTNAVFGFTRDMLFIRKELQPDYLICVFDPPGKTFRDDIYPDYKATRAPMPDSLRPQIGMTYQMLDAMNIPALTKEGFEADDLIATIATSAAKRGIEVFVCTSDKDCRQLLSDKIRLFSLRKREAFDAASLLNDWGVKPDQVIDYQMLVGDSVDNVKGVEGIGPKTASKLLQEFGTLDNVLANIERVAGAKKQENLRKYVSQVPMNRQLIALKTDVPFDLNWDQWRLGDWDAPKLLALFKEWGFRSFAEQVRSGTPVPAAPAVSKSPDQGDLFGEPEIEDRKLPPGDAWDYSKYQLINTPESFADFKKQLATQQRFAVDLETTGLDPRQSDLVGLAFSWQPGEAHYVAVRAPEGEPALDVKTVLAELKPILEARTPAKVNQNIKYDMLAFRQHGVNLAGIVGDSMVAHYVLHSGEREHGMDALSRTYLSHEPIPITDLIGKRGKKQIQMDQVPAIRVAEYSGEDADVALRLCEILEAEVKKEGLDSLYHDVEVPLIEVLAELEFNGIRIDVPRLQAHGEEMAKQLAILEEEIHTLAGRPFNIASLPQLRKVLFDELKLTPRRKTGITKAPSTDQETLEELALEHPLPKKLLEHRKIAKLKSTYVDALPALVNPQTGRVHTSFNQVVAATGRLSSSDPNLQNIPIRTEEGGRIRQAFVPEPGWTLLTADYSQIELRLLAHFCEDEVLLDAFAKDHDIHATAAAQVNGVELADVTSEMRRVAKVINFGIIYGMSAFGLARRLEIPKEDAAAFIEEYFKRYPRVLNYQDELLAKARQQGYVTTILGRRRRFDPNAIRGYSTYHQRNQAEREAINMEIQGSAADLIKVAMLNIHRRLQKEKCPARMLLQIHDELVFEVSPKELQSISRLVHKEMTGALSDRLKVPLSVDISAGPNWLDTNGIDVE